MTEGSAVSGGNLRCTLLRCCLLVFLPPPRFVFLGRPLSEIADVIARVHGLRDVVARVESACGRRESSSGSNLLKK